jgi:flagellar protein FlgJ
MPYNPVSFFSSSSLLTETWNSAKTLKKKGDFADEPGMEDKQNLRVRKACQQMESLFLSQLLKEMRRTIPHDGAIPENNAMNLYQSLFDNHLADLLAQRQTTGLGDYFYRELLDTEAKIP